MKKETFPKPGTLTRTAFYCYGWNRLNKYAIQALNTILPQLEPYAGKKICGSDQTLYKSFKYDLFRVKHIDDIGQHFRTFLSCEGRHLYLHIDICLHNRLMSDQLWTVSYFKHEITVGYIDRDGILTEVYSLEDLKQAKRLDKKYTEPGIVKAQKEIKETEAKLNSLKTRLYPDYQY